MFSFTVTGALAKAASVAALSPASQVKMWLWCSRGPWAPLVLPARSSRSTGASGFRASKGSSTTGSSSYSTCTASTPSAAA